VQDESYKYWAFISYSHRDQVWAEWLHRALETYRVPRRLVGRGSAAGPLPRRLFPVFRDQEELPSSPNLSAAIDQALQRSRYLIVIASPYAAVSKWVDQEIARFRALGRGDRILCLIADGEPHADLQPGKGLLECFPPALHSIEGAEPIAADVRPGKDGKAAARLKLIAGLLGVGLDELRQRERRRRALRNLSWVAAGILSAAVLATVWMAQQREKQQALAQQALQEHIKTVYDKGRQELVERNQARAAVYLNEAYRLGIDTPALRFMLARAMRIVDAQRQTFQTGSAVAILRFSPDSNLLITTGSDSIARIWDLANGRRLFEVPVPQGKSTAIRFNRDSRLVFFTVVDDGSSYGTLNVWDVASGHQLVGLQTSPALNRAFNRFDREDRHVAYVTPTHDAEIADLQTGQVVRRIRGDYTVAGFSRDGRRFLTGAANGEVVIWDHDAQHKLRTLSGLGSHVFEMDDTEDGKLIAASARDGGIRVWQASDGKVRLLAGHPSTNPLLIFNMDGSRLLTSANDGSRVWNTDNGQLVNAWQSVRATTAGTKFDISSNGRWVMESSNGRLVVQDAATGLELYTLDAHQGEPGARDISEDDKLIATGAVDGRVVLWNVPASADAELHHGVDPNQWASEIRPPPATAVFSHSGKLIATGAGDGFLKLWDASTHQLIRSIRADGRSVDAVAFSEDDRRIVSGGYADGVKLWDVGSGAMLLQLSTDGHFALTAAINRDGSAIAAAVQGGTTRLWAVGNGELLAKFDRDAARAMAFSPDGKTFAIGMQQQVRLWDVAQRRFVWSAAPKGPKAEIRALDFSPDGKRILAAGLGNAATVLDAGNGAILNEVHDTATGKFSTAEFSPDQQSALLGEVNGGALLWWPLSGKYRTIQGHAGDMNAAMFSPHAPFVLSSGGDGTTRLWDANTGEILDTIGEQPGQIPEIPYLATSLSPDGRWALTGSTDGAFRLWQLREESRSPEQIAAILKCRVPWQLVGNALQPAAPQPAACPR
jgi:WD40 repeat protein